MILQSETEILNNIHIIAFLVVIATFLIIAVLFSLKMKRKPKNIKNYIRGIVIFMIFYAISRMAEVSKMLFSIFIGTIDPTIADILWYMGAIFGAVALFVLLLVLERYILERKTKFILSILTISLLILAILLDPQAGATSPGKILLYLSSAPALSIPIIYFYIGYKTSGDTRRRSIMAGIGFMIAFLGIIVDTALGNLIFDSLLGNFMGGVLTYITFMICVPVGLLIYYRSIQY